MDAVEFFKERRRMCDSFEGCTNCPIYPDCTDSKPELMVKAVEQWSQSHPQKTIMQDFFEKFPDAPRVKDGGPRMCPEDCGYKESNEYCDDTKFGCLKCWSRPLEES